VTTLDANHCPGAVMFLFQVGNKNILHVGDFRWNREIMQEHLPLRPFFAGQSRLDSIYLDTTYCYAKYTLPTQHAAIQEAIRFASLEYENARRSSHSLLMLFGAYTIGKERIYM
jgi:DNA cross-link repair 1A protein